MAPLKFLLLVCSGCLFENCYMIIKFCFMSRELRIIGSLIKLLGVVKAVTKIVQIRSMGLLRLHGHYDEI